MQERRIFRKEELEELGARTSDLFDAAIEAGDLEKAKSLHHRLAEEAQQVHDAFLLWVAGLLDHVYRRYGDEGLNDALAESYGALIASMAQAFVATADLRTRVGMCAAMLRMHMRPIKIEEDDDKITLMIEPCGSGGCLMLQGRYEPPAGLAKVKKAQPTTFGRENFPVYCTHCAMGDIAALDATGEVVFAVEPGERIGQDPCRFQIYKDRDKVPARIYERIGKRPPGRK